MQLHDLYVRLVAQRVDFGPVNWNAAANLDEAQLRAGLVAYEEDLLCFVEVGNVSFPVDAATEITGARTMARPAADETQAELVDTNANRSNVKGSKEKGHRLLVWSKMQVCTDNSLP